MDLISAAVMDEQDSFCGVVGYWRFSKAGTLQAQHNGRAAKKAAAEVVGRMMVDGSDF